MISKEDLAAIKARYELATSDGAIPYSTYTDSIADIPRLLEEVERLQTKNRQLITMLKNAGMDERVVRGLGE